MEHEELDIFLRLNEVWEEYDLDGPTLDVKPVGVPGVASPQQITNQKPSYSTSPAPSPLKSRKSEAEKDAGALLQDTSLDGVDVTEDDLEKLVMELGLEGDEAGELVKGLGGGSAAPEEGEVEPIKVKTHDEPGHVVVAGKIHPPEKEAEDEKVLEVDPVKEVVDAKAETKTE